MIQIDCYVSLKFYYNFPKSISTPITTNATATIFCRYSVGIYWLKIPPKRTPIRVTATNARLAPRKTEIFDSVLEVIVITANWVLSPSSAKKRVINADAKIFQSIFLIFDFKFAIYDCYFIFRNNRNCISKLSLINQKSAIGNLKFLNSQYFFQLRGN